MWAKAAEALAAAETEAAMAWLRAGGAKRRTACGGRGHVVRWALFVWFALILAW